MFEGISRCGPAKFLDTFFGSYICSKFFKAIIQIFQQALLFKVGLGPALVYVGLNISALHWIWKEVINWQGIIQLNIIHLPIYLGRP